MSDKTRFRIALYSAILIISAGCFVVTTYLVSFLHLKIPDSLSEAYRNLKLYGFNFWIFGVFFVLCSSLVIWYLDRNADQVVHPIDKNRTSSRLDNYGRAEFEKPWQYRSLAQIRPIEDCRGRILGMLDKKGRKCIDFFPDPNDPSAHLNENIFAIGASGSGKTFTVGKNYCFQSIKLGHSVIHTDPKGELFSEMANIYRENGYIVRRLDFCDPQKSDGWDAMKVLREASDVTVVETLVDRFSSAIIEQLYTSGKDGVFKDGANLLLKALLLRSVLDKSSGFKSDLNELYSWISNPDGAAFLEELFDETTCPASAFPAMGAWASFQGASGNLRGNIQLNLSSGLGSLNSTIMRDILSTDDIDISLPGKEPCAYFVQFPVPNDTYRFAVALFFTMLFETLQLQAILSPTHTLERKVDFFLDEFAQCGVFPYWDQRMSVFRSFGISVFMIVQTISQLENYYKHSMDTIISNCATWLMLGANDFVSAEVFSKRIGQTTIEVESESRKGWRRLFRLSGGMGRSVNVATGRTSLISSDEIMKLPANSLLIVFQRHNPIFANSVPSTLHPFIEKCTNTTDEIEPFFYDKLNEENQKPTRKERFVIENFRINSFKNSHDYFSPPADISDALYSHGPERILLRILRLFLEDLNFLFSSLRRFKHEDVFLHTQSNKNASEREFEPFLSNQEVAEHPNFVYDIDSTPLFDFSLPSPDASLNSVSAPLPSPTLKSEFGLPGMKEK